MAQSKKLFRNADIVKFLETQIIKWLGYILTDGNIRKVSRNGNSSKSKPGANPRRRWMVCIEEDMVIMEVKNYR